MFYKNNKSWFSLIEILIAITIFLIITIYTFGTYVHYQKKAILNDWIKEISQSLYEARNLAINWLNDDSKNKSIWLYFDKNINQLKYYSYDYTLSWSQIKTDVTIPWISLLKTKTLNSDFYIENISWKTNWMFFFHSISWKWEYFYFDSFNNRVSFWINKIDINVSYKHSISTLMNKTISYYTDTYITDY